MKYIRHGDISLKPLKEKLPKNLKEIVVESNIFVLAYGEATGHQHRLVGDFDILQDKDGRYFVQVKGDTKIEHWNTITDTPAEHKTLPLEVGVYVADNEQDFNPFTEEINKVQD